MSAGAKQEALDRLSIGDEEKNSVFTRVFLGELAKPGRTLVQIAKATQVGVRDLAATVGYEQTPAYYDEVVGDVVLSDAAPSAPIAGAAPRRTRKSRWRRRANSSPPCRRIPIFPALPRSAPARRSPISCARTPAGR